MQPIPAAEGTFCIAVLGDFLGEASASPEGADAYWVPRRATPDTVMKLSGLRPRCRLSAVAGMEPLEVEFSSLEDFHPADLFRRLDRFAPLRDAREGAKEGRPDPGATSSRSEPEKPGKADGEVLGNGNLLEAILDVSEPPDLTAEQGSREELEAFVRKAVRPHLVRDDSDIKARVADVDHVAGAGLSDVLHDESFQALESIWRSLVFLLSRVDTTGKVRVYLVHLPKEELKNDLAVNDDPTRSKLYQLLSAPQLGNPGRKWALVTGAYQFELEPEEIALMGRVARVAQAADVPWISAVGPGSMFERQEGAHHEAGLSLNPPEAWHLFRGRPEARWMGLTFPRFLLREPHEEVGRRSDAPRFKEEITTPDHLLWGLGAFLPAVLLAQGFAVEGWELHPNGRLELEGMPMWNTQMGMGILPTSVEVALDPNQAQRMVEQGVMPLVGFPERAGVRIGGIHPVSGARFAFQAWWRG